jgi:hypothetical protein
MNGENPDGKPLTAEEIALRNQITNSTQPVSAQKRIQGMGSSQTSRRKGNS